MFDRVRDQFYDTVIQPRVDLVLREVHGPWFAAVAWGLAVAGAARWWRGPEALRDVTTWLVVVVGAGACWLVTWWWIRTHPRPLVLVAEFASIGGEEAGAEAQAVRDRVRDAIRGQAEEGGLPVRVRAISTVVDPDDAGWVLRRARSARAPVLVAGKSRVDADQWHWSISVMTVGQQFAWRPSASGADSVGVGAQRLDTEREATRDDLVGRVAATARLALGIALLQAGLLDHAHRVLSSGGGPTTPLTLLYVALVDWQRGRHEDALRAATASYGVVRFAPTAGLAAVVSYELGRTEEARAWVDRMLDESVPAGPEWTEFVTRATTLARAHGVVDAIDTLQAGLSAGQDRIDDAFEQWGAAQNALERRSALRGLWVADDFSGLAARLDESAATGDPFESALLAGALAHLGDERARDVAESADRLVSRSEPDPSNAGCLVEAFAILGDPTRTAHWLAAELEAGEGVPHLSASTLLVMYEVRLRDADVPSEFWDDPAFAELAERFPEEE